MCDGDVVGARRAIAHRQTVASAKNHRYRTLLVHPTPACLSTGLHIASLSAYQAATREDYTSHFLVLVTILE